MQIHPSPPPAKVAAISSAIGLMVLAMASFAAMNSIIRLLVGEMPSSQMVFLRNVFSLLLIVFWVFVRGEEKNVLKTDKPKAHFWRSAVGFCAMSLWFYAVSLMPLNQATALSFTTPIFSTIFAILILKEKAGVRRFLAVAIGFAGVLIILRPDSQTLDQAAIIVLVSSALMALAGVTVKHLTRTERPETIVLYMSLFMTPLSAPLAFLHWEPVTFHAAWLLALVALFSTISHLLMTRAYRRADMVVLMPFDFTRLIFTAILTYFMFGERLDAYTILGAAIITFSSVYIVHRERVRKREQAQHT